jgi:hypothetical protein
MVKFTTLCAVSGRWDVKLADSDGDGKADAANEL